MRILAAFILTVFLTSCAETPAISYAWWVHLRIEPQGTEYLRIPVGSLSLPLKKLTLFSCTTNPTFTSNQCAEVEKNSASFEIEGDFNNDNEKDVARVGVAELQGGALVHTLLIGPAAIPGQHQILTVQDNGFSALYSFNGLSWYFCMQCDDGADVRWDPEKRQYLLQWGEEYGQRPSNKRFQATPSRYALGSPRFARRV